MNFSKSDSVADFLFRRKDPLSGDSVLGEDGMLAVDWVAEDDVDDLAVEPNEDDVEGNIVDPWDGNKFSFSVVIPST